MISVVETPKGSVSIRRAVANARNAKAGKSQAATQLTS